MNNKLETETQTSVTQTQILVVEDELILAEDIKNTLTALGYSVPDIVVSGEEAVRQTDKLRPDLVLMDIRLHGKMDGITAAEQIQVSFNIPVIYLTAFSDNATLQRAKITEPFGYVVKPAETRDLHVAVEMALCRHRLETRLKESERWLDTTLRSIGDGVIATDAAGRVIFMNSVAEGMTGWKQADAEGRDLTEVFRIVTEATGELAENPVKRVLREGVIAGLANPTLLIRKDGTEIPIDDSGAPIRDDEGTVTGVVLVFRDITERKRAEEEKLLLERQLQHTQKLESLGVMAGGIAHDFNNILMIILGNADLALNELSPMSLARGSIREIEKASKRAAELVKQMLAYSGKGQFVIEPIDAGKLFEEMAHLLKVSISKKAVLRYNFAENLPSFDGDVAQISQIIMNLITNASESIGDRSGVIALSTGAMNCDRAYLNSVSETLRASLGDPLPEGFYVYFEVADTGCGMDKETIENIFDPFFTTKFTGRGLGMSAVLGIVRAHKGAIKIHSEVGKGTTFKVLFPTNKLPDNSFASRRKDDAEVKDWRGRGTVLIADDEEMICKVGKQMLERLGFSVLTASDGHEALKMFRQHACDIACVLLDMTMPHMNGEETFREMRRIHPDVTVILCSGYNEQEVTQRFAGKGLAGFIQKPYTMATLKEKLMEILHDTTSDREA